MSLDGNDLSAGANKVGFGDTEVEVQTDDTIDVDVAGALDFEVLANILRALSGSVFETDTINETTTDAGVTVDGVLLKDDGVDATAYSLSTADVTDILEYPMTEASYVVWSDGATPATYYAKNGADGTVDSNANLQTVIQTAVDSCSGGGQVYVTASVVGSYSGTILIENSDIQIIGARGNQLTHTGTGAAILISGTALSYIENAVIDGLHLIGSGGNEEDLVTVEYGNNIVVQNCIFEDSFEEGVAYYDCIYSKIRDNYFNNCGTDVINPSIEVKDTGVGNPCYGNKVEGKDRKSTRLNSSH